MPPLRGAQRPISGKSRFLKLQVTCRHQVAPHGKALAVMRRNRVPAPTRSRWASWLTACEARRRSQANSVSRSDAEEIMSVISDEVTENLDDDWEPTDYGRAVSAVLAQFNAAHLSEWP